MGRSRSRSRLLATLGCGLGLAFALAACGGGSSDESEITASIEAGAIGKEKSTCTELETARFVEQSTGETGAAAVKVCKEHIGSEQPDRVVISEIAVDGTEATADVGFEGGPYDGLGIEIALVEENGRWKLDETVEFTEFDEGALVAQLAEAIGKSEPQLSDGEVSCFADGLGRSSREDLEGLVLDTDPALLEELSRTCT